MKKFYLFLTAILIMAFTTRAQEQGTIVLGDWDAPATYNGSFFDMAPTNFYLAHTGAQMLYTPDLLADLDGKDAVRINQLQFMFHSESFEEIVRDVKIYVELIPETAFAVVDGVKQFFNLGNLVYDGSTSIDLVEYYGEDMVLDFVLDEPVEYIPGMSLLVTMVFDAQDDDNCTMGSDYAPFYTSGIAGKAMTYTDNWSSFLDYTQGSDFPDATSMLGCGTNVDLPLTRIGYSYEDAPIPMEACLAPNMMYEIITDGEAQVTITNREEGAMVFYEVYLDEELILSGSFDDETYSFMLSDPGYFQVYAIAKMDGKLDSSESFLFFTLTDPIQPTYVTGDVDGDTKVTMDDLSALINYLLTGDDSGINMEGAGACDGNDGVSMDDLSALINYLLTGAWPE